MNKHFSWPPIVTANSILFDAQNFTVWFSTRAPNMLFTRLRELLTLANIFALICTFCTCYLLVLVVLNFAVTRPTSTSEERVELDSTSFPDVVACVDPLYNKTVLERYVYLQWTITIISLSYKGMATHNGLTIAEDHWKRNLSGGMD